MLDTELHKLLAPYIEAPVECDGFTRLAHTALANAGIEHICMLGRVVSADGLHRSPVHYWIELADGRVIDYRARMWLGEGESVPYGLFHKPSYALWSYEGQPIDLPVLNPVLVKVLMLSIPLHLLKASNTGDEWCVTTPKQLSHDDDRSSGF